MLFAPRSENAICKLVFVPCDNEKPMVELSWPIEEDDEAFVKRVEEQIGAKELAYFSFPQEERERFEETGSLRHVVERVMIAVNDEETTEKNANTRLCCITGLWLPGDACIYMQEEEEEEEAVSYDLPLTTVEEMMRTLQTKRRKTE